MKNIARRLHRLSTLLLLGFFVLFSSCAGGKKTILHALSKESYCVPPGSFNYFNVTADINRDSIVEANADLKDRYTLPSILIMDALGIDEEVRAIERLKKDTSLAARVELLTLKQTINRKITLVNSEIDATTAELDCEGERVEQIAGMSMRSTHQT